MKRALKEKAVELRGKGFSYSYIATHVPVSKSTLHEWLANIPYTPNAHTIRTIGTAHARSGEAKSKIKRQSIADAHRLAKTNIGNITERDIFMLGIGLYIGEGSKTNSIVRIVNSDPAIIRFAILWLTRKCGVSNSNLVARIHLYPDIDIAHARRYWSQETGLQVSQFQKESVDRRTNKQTRREGVCPFGTMHLSVRARGNKELGTALSRRIGAWMALMLEYATLRG